MQTDITSQPPPRHADAEIEFALDPEDHVACRLFLRGPPEQPDSRPRSLRPGDLFLFLTVLLGIAVLLWNYRADQTLLVADLMVALAVLVLWIILLRQGPTTPPRDRLLVVKEEVEKLRALGVIKIGRQDRVSMDGEGFTEVNDYRETAQGFEMTERRETRVCWSQVQSIDLAEAHVIIAVTAKGCLFVPRRVFEDGAAFHRFVAAARQFRQAYIHRGKTEIALAPADQSDGLRKAP